MLVGVIVKIAVDVTIMLGVIVAVCVEFGNVPVLVFVAGKVE